MGLRAAVKPMFEPPSPTPHLSGYALFKQTALEFVVFIRPTSTAYMYLYLEGEKVGLEIFFNAISVYQVRHYQTPGRCQHIVLILNMCYRCILQVKGVYSCQRLLVSAFTVT